MMGDRLGKSSGKKLVISFWRLGLCVKVSIVQTGWDVLKLAMYCCHLSDYVCRVTGLPTSRWYKTGG